jgi:hypothetical protein
MTRRWSPWAATLTLVLGLGMLLSATALVGADLQPSSDELAVWAVWGLSIAVIVLGFTFSFADLARLWSENAALARARKHGPVLLTPEASDLPSSSAVYNLRDFTLQSRDSLAPDLTHVRSGAHRIITRALGNIGAVPRFLSSLLLLLAVTGTFLGMRKALPPLVAAIQAKDSNHAVASALQEVTNAFGANFVALIGALALAVAGFGAARSRRDLTMAIESLLDEHLLSRLPAGLEATVVERLISELRASVHEMTGTGQQLGDLRTSIDRFADTLGNAVDQVQGTLLTTIQRDLVGNQNRLIQSLDLIREGVVTHARAAEATAISYEGMASSLTAQHSTLAAATKDVTEAARRLEESTRFVDANIKAASVAIEGVAPRLGALATELHALTGSLGASDAETRHVVEAQGSRVVQALGVVTERAGTLAQDVAALRGAMPRWELLAPALEGIGVTLSELPRSQRELSAEVQRLLASILDQVGCLGADGVRWDALAPQLQRVEEVLGSVAGLQASAGRDIERTLTELRTLGAKLPQPQMDGLRDTVGLIEEHLKRLGVRAEALQKEVATTSAAVAGTGDSVAALRTGLVGSLDRLGDALNRR